MINVDLGDGRIFPMEEHLLEGPILKRTENGHEVTTVTEYRLRGKLVHRSVHVQLKHGLGIEGILGRIG